MEIFTIGFTQSSAERFFGRIKQAGIRRLMDVRLNNRSQLAGFAKKDDLTYFLKVLCNADYCHQPLLAPTLQLLDDYKKNGGNWSDYERDFMALMESREIENVLKPDDFAEPTVLLCSESTAECCHRRLVIDYLQAHWGEIKVVHL